MKNFFQRNIWFGLAIGVYAIGIFASGILLLQLSELLGDLPDNVSTKANYLVIVIIIELLLGLILMVAFYVQWQRKQAQGDIIYVDRYVGGETAQNEETESDSFDWNAEQKRLQELIEGKDKKEVLNYTLRYLAKKLEIVSGAAYIAHQNQNIRQIEMVSTYAFTFPDSQSTIYEFGEGIAGQVAKLGKPTYIENVPKEYLKVLSGLGDSSSVVLLAVPVLENQEVKAVIELASFRDFTDIQQKFVKQVGDHLATHL